jgi:hypothetical protein
MKRLLFALLLLLLLSAPDAWGTTWVCGSDADMDSAIAGLAAADTIVVAGSWTSDAEYNVNKAGVTVNSTSPGNIILHGPAATGSVLKLTSTGITVTGFTIDGNKANKTSGQPITITGSGCTVSYMVLKDGFNYDLQVSGTGGNNIRYNIFMTPGGIGILKTTYGDCVRINTGSGNNIVEYNMFYGDTAGACGVFNNSAPSNTIRHNGFYDICRVPVEIYGVASSGASVEWNTMDHWGLDADSNGVTIRAANCGVRFNCMRQSADTGFAIWGVEFTGGANACDGSIAEYNLIGGGHINRGFGGGGSSVTIRRNYIEAKDKCIYQENCSPIEVSYNHMRAACGAGERGVELHSNAAGARIANIFNNTLLDADTTECGFFLNETTGTWSQVNFRGNVAVGFGTGLLVEGTVLTHTNNLYNGNSADISLGGAGHALDPTETATDPKLGSDGRPLAGSPAIDAGYDWGQVCDSAGTPIRGRAWDIGAYEFRRSPLRCPPNGVASWPSHRPVGGF